jgi:hypothetical protein
MDELGNTSCRLDLVGDPLPVANRLHRHRRTPFAPFKTRLQRPSLLREPLPTDQPTVASTTDVSV